MDRPYRLKLVHITKSFPGVLAVRDVSLEAYPGEILSLVGENGAGKSTLMNVLNAETVKTYIPVDLSLVTE